MIHISDSAVLHLRELLASKNAVPGSGLRLQVEKGGCAGMQYAMKIDTITSTDHVFREQDVCLIVDPESLKWLDDSSLEYVEALNDSGFKIENPNAARSCGCGTSFEPRAD
jgi:iron-sulfur cluster assembly protein